MNNIKTLIRKIKYRITHGFFSIENIVLIGSIILCLFLTYQSVLSMSRNWELSERLISEKKQLELLNVEVEASQLENEYYKSDEYQELIARRDLDKKNSGENMVVMPENTEQAKNKHKKTSLQEEKEYSNLEKWAKFLLPEY